MAAGKHSDVAEAEDSKDSHDEEGSEWAAPLPREIADESKAPPVSAITESSAGTHEGARAPPVYKVDHIGRHMRSSKLRHAWTLFLQGEPAEVKVELEHSRFSGKKKVFIDGKLVFSTKERRLSWSWQHPKSKAVIDLQSENGNHSLRCQEHQACSADASTVTEGTGQDPGTASQADSQVSSGAVTTWAVWDALTPPRRHRRRSGSRHSSRSSSQSSRPWAARQEQLQDEEAEAAVAEEAKPSVPLRSSSFSSQTTDLVKASSASASTEETARLHALMRVKDAQIAKLEGELRRSAQSASEDASCLATADVPTPPRPAGQVVLLPPPQLQQSPEPVSSWPNHLVAELPTLSVLKPDEAKPAALTEQQTWDNLDAEELDVTHRHGPSCHAVRPELLATPQKGTPAYASPAPRCRAVTPRQPVVVRVETVETPYVSDQIRGRAGSVPPRSSLHGASSSSGRPERLLSVPPPPRSSSVHTPHRIEFRQVPGTPRQFQARSVTPHREVRHCQPASQVLGHRSLAPPVGLQAPLQQGACGGWQMAAQSPLLVQGWHPNCLQPGAVGQMAPVMLLPPPKPGQSPALAHPGVGSPLGPLPGPPVPQAAPRFPMATPQQILPFRL